MKTAHALLTRLYHPDYRYKKAGVIVMGIGPDSPIQQDLFDTNAEQFQKMRRLDKALTFANAIKHDFRSKNPTTRWSDIIVLK